MISFADEEGARFNTPTFGSRALVGRLDVDDAVARLDDDGIALGDAMAAAGVDPAGLPTRLRGSSACAGSSSCTSTSRATSRRPGARPGSSPAWRRGCGCRR